MFVIYMVHDGKNSINPRGNFGHAYCPRRPVPDDPYILQGLADDTSLHASESVWMVPGTVDPNKD